MPKPIVEFHADFSDRCITSTPHKGVTIHVNVEPPPGGSMWHLGSWDRVQQHPKVTVEVVDRFGHLLTLQTCGENSSLNLKSHGHDDWMYVGSNLLTVASRVEGVCGAYANLVTFHLADVCEMWGGPAGSTINDVPTWYKTWYTKGENGVYHRYGRSDSDRNVFIYDGITLTPSHEERTP